VCDQLDYNVLGTDFFLKYPCLIDLLRRELIIGDIVVPLMSKSEALQLTQISLSVLTASQHAALPPDITQQLDVLPGEDKLRAQEMLEKYAATFENGSLGCTSQCQHRIELTDPRTIKQQPRRLSAVQRKQVEEEVEKMDAQGVIRPSYSPWASQIVLVPKKDGSTRFCVDYRALNAKTKIDAYPMPYPQDILDGLSGSDWFCTLDLKAGFWQIPMALEDVEKTAFCVPGGHYEFLRMPFGLVNATATFQRCMEKVLHGLIGRGVGVFVDDVVVYAPTFATLMTRLEEVLQRIQTAGLVLNVKKCKLFHREAKLLGHIISGGGIRPDTDQLKAITSWATPRNRREVRSFLGKVGYYRKFVPDFSEISAPLNELLSMKVHWEWGPAHESAFHALKDKLTSPPVLAYFDPTLPTMMDCDASGTGIGAVLLQEHPEGERVVAYFSRCLSSQERNYCVTRRELLAILEALRVWKHYAHGQKVKIRTDHSSLMWLKNFREPEGQLARWIEKLSQFDTQLEYRKGSASTNADALSRRPCVADCPNCSRAESKDAETARANACLAEEFDWCVHQDADDDFATVKG